VDRVNPTSRPDGRSSAGIIPPALGNATIPLDRRAATSKAGFVRWAILVVHLYFRQSVRKTLVSRTISADKNAGACQTEQRDEFTELKGCAVKRMSFGTRSDRVKIGPLMGQLL
jgi:hypothetical protein